MNRQSIPALRQLAHFWAVIEAGSLSRAALLVHVSQPSLSQSLSALERSFGITLLTRGRQGTYPTEAGSILKLRAGRLFDQLEQAVAATAAGPAQLTPGACKRIVGRLTHSQIDALIAVSEAHSLRSAAAALGIAAPSVHRSLRELEVLTRRSLYRRAASGIAVTPAGRELARRVKVALREIDYARDEIQALEGAHAGRLRIGVIPLFASALLGSAIERFSALHPFASVVVQEGPYETLLSSLRNGSIDIIFGVLRAPAWVEDLEERALYDDPYLVFARKGHPLARSKGRITQADLSAYPWVVPMEGTPRRIAFDGMFGEGRRVPKILAETNSSSLQRALVSTSNAITMLSGQEARSEERSGRYVALSCKDLPSRRRDGVTVRKHWRPTALHEAFLDLLVQVHKGQRDANVVIHKQSRK